MIGKTFYRVAAVASFASVATTIAIIFLPRLFPAIDGLDARMALVAEPAYQARAWAYFVHPFLTFAAALAVALRLRNTKPGQAIVGTVAFFAWAFTEALQQAMTLFAFDRWRVAYAAADEATRVAIAARVPIYDGLWDAMYFMIIVAFLIANVAFAIALIRSRGLSRVVGWFYAAAATLTATLIAGEFGAPYLPAWTYPAIQPVARALIGLWLWQNADESRNLGDFEPRTRP